MIDGIRGIPAVIVIIEVILIMNDDRIVPAMRTVISPIISVIMVIVIGMVYPHSHDSKSSKIRWIISIVVGRIIGNVGRGVYILNDRRRFNDNDT